MTTALPVGLSLLLACSLFHTLVCVLVVRLFVRLLRQGYIGSHVWGNVLLVEGFWCGAASSSGSMWRSTHH